MSTMTNEGVCELRNEACDLLLAFRVDNKVKSKKVDSIMNRLHVSQPVPRDDKVLILTPLVNYRFPSVTLASKII